MARKFLDTLHALVENYATNKVVHMKYSTGVGWAILDSITAGPFTSNLSSIACNQQGSRVLYANYSGNGVVPLDYNGTTWTPGTLVPAAVTGNTDAVAMSDDGLHALSGGDFQSAATPYEYDVATGLWVAGVAVSVPTSHLDSIGMIRDGSRALVVPKYDDIAIPLARDPGTMLWAVSGSSIALNSSSERFFGIGISPDGRTAVIGSNQGGIDSDGLLWDGSVWNRVSIPIPFGRACWSLDGKTIICSNGEAEAGAIKVINYDPLTREFSAGQVISGFLNIGGVQVVNNAIGDTALVSDFGGNTVTPLTYSRTTGLWSVGTVISYADFDNPFNMLVFPIW